MGTPNTKRMYDGVFIGFGIRGTIADDKTFRIRRGNGFYGAIDGEIYQDKYTYFVPGSINNAASEPYRRQWAAAVHKWKYGLKPDEKQEYNAAAVKGLCMSGFNLFMRKAMEGQINMFVDRGDPGTYDYGSIFFQPDASWHNLDVSAKVPAGAKAVLLKMQLDSPTAEAQIKWREAGNSNDINTASCQMVKANTTYERSSVVAISPSRVLAYRADNVIWAKINMTIRGWWT